MNRKTFPMGSLLLFALFLLMMLATWLLLKPPAPPAQLQGVLRPEYRSLQPFTLTDQRQRRFDQTSLRGKWSMIFFGYLSCPDICPLTLHELNSFWRLLRDESGSDPQHLQIVFVSVDPARDSPQQLGEYVSHFNRHFIAATGSKAQIDRLASQFGAGYALEPETAPGQYLVRHSSAIFLVDPLGRSVATFSQPHYASTLLTQFRRISAYFASASARRPASAVFARTGFLPLPPGPGEIGPQQNQIDDDPDSEEPARRVVFGWRHRHFGMLALAGLTSTHGS